MNGKKIIPVCLGALIAMPMLAGCDSNEPVGTQVNQNSDNNNPQIVVQNQETYLAVDTNKCVGCGKCVQTDPAHFIMDSNTQKSVVVSQSDLASDSLSVAISRCPVDAITL
jgi:ferredoxin